MFFDFTILFPDFPISRFLRFYDFPILRFIPRFYFPDLRTCKNNIVIFFTPGGVFASIFVMSLVICFYVIVIIQ